jgi:hypothetical protein
MYNAIIPSSLASAELLSENMKAYHYYALAEIELGRPDDALKSGRTAYSLCSGAKSGVVDRVWNGVSAPSQRSGYGARRRSGKGKKERG